VIFHDGDLEICKLLTPYVQARYPWGYTYLPTRYFAPLLQRGADNMPNRLAALRGNDYVKLPDQPLNNCRDLIYQLGKAGYAEIRDLGYEFEIHPRTLPHELGACLTAADIELGARKYDLPIDLITVPPIAKRPDWPVFTLCGNAVFVEFDTGTESSEVIKGKYECYLTLLHSKALRKPLFLFVTTKPNRVDTLIKALKETVDQHGFPYVYAAHFAFGHMNYDKYLNRIPDPSGCLVTHPLRRAGLLEPFKFYSA
jgi:hypothetical protein